MSPAATMEPADAVLALQRATDELFYDHGISGVAVMQIRDASGVSMRRLYSMYPSKSDLVSLWLRYRHEMWTAGFTAAVEANLKAGETPANSVFDALASWMKETAFRGCGFINTHAESNELTEEHREIIRDHKRELAEYLTSVTGHGEALAVLVDGAIVQASIFSSTDPIEAARTAAKVLMESR